MTVEEYEQEFDKLSHFGSEMVATEAAKIERFFHWRSFARITGFLGPKSYDAALWATVKINVDAHEGDEYRRPLLVGTFVGQKRKAE